VVERARDWGQAHEGKALLCSYSLLGRLRVVTTTLRFPRTQVKRRKNGLIDDGYNDRRGVQSETDRFAVPQMCGTSCSGRRTKELSVDSGVSG